MNQLSRSIAENQLRAMFALASGSEWLGYPIEVPSQGVNNQTYLVRGEGSGVVLKLRPVGAGARPGPCPHWPAYTCALFGEYPNGELESLVEVTRLLADHGSLPVPRIFLCGTSAALGQTFLASELMPGTPFDWSARPLGIAALEQMGEHLGRLHRGTSRQDFGIFAAPSYSADQWWPRFSASFRILCDELAAVSAKVAALRPRLEAALERAVATGAPEEFGLVCIDQSPSHYLGDTGGKITGFVDIEGHLWGPPEWELAMLQCWVADFEALLGGYGRHTSVFEDVRAAYQAYTVMEWMYCMRFLVGNPAEAERLEPHLEWKLQERVRE